MQCSIVGMFEEAPKTFRILPTTRQKEPTVFDNYDVGRSRPYKRDGKHAKPTPLCIFDGLLMIVDASQNLRNAVCSLQLHIFNSSWACRNSRFEIERCGFPIIPRTVFRGSPCQSIMRRLFFYAMFDCLDVRRGSQNVSNSTKNSTGGADSL